ncbi:Acetyltransferase (GNAT) family protein [Actinacidiphila yanglinensis]|uniref:Acetyltransferase (GNAT) family protein n=1 Tax=Actinacidiphila yanglinensis TaxID=310779 RepID=A0A1H6DW34_9ACTN|nr:GNAT family N-acetyltransferase [Actinacidiphila yanglinensis]SEG88936.1 Acetyltransferase (GNAT) family protein [Actinacidiphila yanglinensis]
MDYEIRPVLPAEWRRSRQLRLTALQDPVAPVAFARTYAEESAMSEDDWRRRASGEGAQQFVAVSRENGGIGEHGDHGESWVGLTVAVIERPEYISVNAVYLVPEARGSGLADRLFAAVQDWAWQRTDRLHLWVHEKNPRAEAFYRRMGFRRTGEWMASPLDASFTEYEMALDRP